jgi:hypothetical protein
MLKKTFTKITPTVTQVIVRQVDEDKPKCWVEGNYYNFNSKIVNSACFSKERE